MISLFKVYVDDINKKKINIDFDAIMSLLNIANDRHKELSDKTLTNKNIRVIKAAINNSTARYKDFKGIEDAFQLYLKTFRIKDRDFIDHFSKLLNNQIESDIKYLNSNIANIFSTDMSSENIRVKELFVFMYLTNILKVFDIVEIFILGLNTNPESLPGVVYEDVEFARGFFNFLLEIKSRDISYHLKLLDREKLSNILVDKDIDSNVYKIAEKKLGNKNNFITSNVFPFSNTILTFFARYSSRLYGSLESKKNWIRKKIEVLEYENRNGPELTTEKNDLLELIAAYKNQYLKFLEEQERLK